MLGRDSLSWRLYDLGLGWSALLAMSIIARPTAGGAGVLAGALFSLLHAGDGVAELEQRDLLMTVTLLWTVALFLQATRRKDARLLAGAAAVGGYAVTVKPSAAIFWMALAGSSSLATKLLGAAGQPSCWQRALLFSRAEHRARYALSLSRPASILDYPDDLIPYHNSLGRLPFLYFVTHLIPSSLTALLLVWLGPLLLRYLSKLEVLSSEEMVLLVCAVCGSVSFALQGKGYSYHRYPMTAFLVLLLCITSVKALRGLASQSLQVAGLLSVCLGGFVLAPQCLWGTRHLGATLRISPTCCSRI